MTSPTLIIPGLHGSGEGHWQRFWLDDTQNARMVEQDDWDNPEEKRWMARLEAAIIDQPGSVLVAHSLGSILAARLAQSPVAHLVAGAFLVAPADIERTGKLNERDYEFGSLPTDRLPFPSIVVASRDDIYMSLQMAHDLAKSWGSTVVDLGYAGHVNIASGYGRWPESYRLSASLFSQAG